MAEELFIPKLGQTVEEVTLINWLVKDGEKVEQGQAVLEVETDKAVFEVEATDSGYIHMGPFKAGDVVPVLAVVGIIGEKDEVFSAPAPAGAEEKPAPAEKAAAASAPVEATAMPAAEKKPALEEPKKEAPAKVFASPRARKLANAEGVDLSQVTPTGGGGARVREMDVQAYLAEPSAKASPIARRMAAEAGLDLRALRGSGPRGEITRADVEMALARGAAPESAPAVKSAPLPPMEVAETMPLKGVRGVIAERMGASVHTTAHVTLLMEADATEFAALRQKLKAEKEAAWGFAPGYNELLAKACACALRRFPYMNARLNGDVIERLARVNIGIAVDAERGLYVPVLRDVDQKDLRALGSELRQRVEEIRSGKISPEHLSGGTFTITNLGAYDVDGFTPVINLPEAAILGVGRIAPKAVARDGKVVARTMVTLSLVFDHRLVDGAPAAQFLKYLKEMIENPNEVTLTL